MSILSWGLAKAARLSPPETTDVVVEHDLEAKMPDGETLLADRWFAPATVASAPIVLLRSPYGRRRIGFVGRLFAERGYQAVIQSCRGTFGSGGTFDPFHHEAVDGTATLEWLSWQPWFTDAVGTFGPSYLGLTQWSVAANAPAFVRAMALSITASRFREGVVYPGESFSLETGVAWVDFVELQERCFWRRQVARATLRKRFRAAYDCLPIRCADRAALAHEIAFYQDWLTHRTSTAGAAALRDALDWFDVQLRSRPQPPAAPRVRLYVMGGDRWVDLPDWPPPSTDRRWYLHPAGRLYPHPPAPGPPDGYRYDPVDPTPGVGGASLDRRNAGSRDQRPRERRADVLSYTSDPCRSDVTVAGELRAKVWLRTSQPHIDVFLRLCDVEPSGRSRNISDGIVRIDPARIRAEADGTRCVGVSLAPTAMTFRRGHRIRMQESSGAHPLIVRNTGSGERLAAATRLVATDVQVLHDPHHPSMVELPVSPI